ncbi:hypothetical protein EDC30_11924 [Paucimonas lemoignei]|uniref:Uncharacterized protein n=1 Tax=Paucimonas lemoignei TaxID=29443 RepID=A0A4R3HS89_PAULE|nr:hypothetical protein EDC30_11924 [Paucimonas lemoignei]
MITNKTERKYRSGSYGPNKLQLTALITCEKHSASFAVCRQRGKMTRDVIRSFVDRHITNATGA